jgi:hypothetical protein
MSGGRKRQKCEPTLVDQDHSKGFYESSIEEIRRVNPHMDVQLSEVAKWKSILRTLETASSQTVYFHFTSDGITVIASGSASNTCITHWNKDMFKVYTLTEEFAFTLTKSDLKELHKFLQVSLLIH